MIEAGKIPHQGILSRGHSILTNMVILTMMTDMAWGRIVSWSVPLFPIMFLDKDSKYCLFPKLNKINLWFFVFTEGFPNFTKQTSVVWLSDIMRFCDPDPSMFWTVHWDGQEWPGGQDIHGVTQTCYYIRLAFFSTQQGPT